jgi:transcriptional regulator with XRE-family HTH domain
MKLVEARRSRLLSMRALAEKANVSLRTINNIEMGYITPHLSTIQKLADALEIDPMEIEELASAIRSGGKEPALASV